MTLADVDKVAVAYIELGSAPFPALSFTFTKQAALRLVAALKTTAVTEFVVFIDGHCYSTVDAGTLKTLLAGNRVLNITVRGPYDDSAAHLVQLIAEKLSTKIAKR